MKKFLIFILLIFCNFLLAQIIEIKSVSEIENLEKYRLILFDLDNTVMEPVQILGSDQWFYHTLKKHEKEGLDSQKALDKTLFEWYEIQSITQVKLVEEEIKNLIENLQEKNVKIIGLTTRNVGLIFAAIKQLDSLNIDFSKTAPCKNNLFFEDGVIYKKGVLFANGKSKDWALKSFFRKVGFFPKSIVFVDDKLKHVQEIENFCKLYNVKFLGYRYGYLDEKIKSFNSEIADIQYKTLKKILSDKEALIYLEKSKK